MPELERWEFGNPEAVAARKESKTCKGCKYLESIILFGRRTEICGFGRPSGNRCKKYKEMTID